MEITTEESCDSSADSVRSPISASSPTASNRESSIATTPAPGIGKPHPGEAGTETNALLSSLEGFLGIGCLILSEPAAGEHLEIPRWQEVTEPSLLNGFDGSLHANVQSLLAAGWIRVFRSPSVGDQNAQIYRVYVLPFDVRRSFLNRQSSRLLKALEELLHNLDVGARTWEGPHNPAKPDDFDPHATKEDGSLFWMFNKLPSPAPDAQMLTGYARESLEDLLDSSGLPGLRTALYPYQRRSAGMMMQRESSSTLTLDPRLEQRQAPDGTYYYYSARESRILREPIEYEACKGGILAEQMGTGKTLMCLALILATKKHLPQIPPAWNQSVTRHTVGSLASMAVSSINRKAVPWEVEFERIRMASGEDMSRCRERLEKEPASYEIIEEPQRWNRTTVIPPPRRVILAATTLIVVPHNLLRQWRSEIHKHVENGVLNMLVMEDSKKPLPAPAELRKYDVVLFTRKRFEQESKDGSDNQGRRMATTQRACRCPYIGDTRIRDCTCLRTDDLYDSPLKHLHFKRVIVDEGHFFSNNSGVAATVAEKLLKVDHRWVVSGTPAKDLLGVEVDTSSAENVWRTPETQHARERALQQRRNFSDLDKIGAIKSLGSLAKNFLRIRPWTDDDRRHGETKADWDECIFRHEGKTKTGFSTSLRRSLEAMVIKTRPSDVDKDIVLPPLSHKIVRLQPSFYDRLTANLFTLVLTANAVTSERTDQDYLFHRNSAKARYSLVANLRQSAFFWTGFSEHDIMASITRGNTYLNKADVACSSKDRALLTDCLKTAEIALQSQGWKSMSRSHELGILVDDWPTQSRDHWAFDKSRQPLLTGLSQVLEAQRHVHLRSEEEDPFTGLSHAGMNAVADTKFSINKDKKEKEKNNSKQSKGEQEVLNKAGIPSSSLSGEPTLKRRVSSVSQKSSPTKTPSKPTGVTKPSKGAKKAMKRAAKRAELLAQHVDHFAPQTSSSTGHEKASSGQSPARRSRIVGTTSAKLSYLLGEILKYHQEEKILVFYDGENAAFYLAQALDAVHIKHEIYAKALKSNMKSEYVVRFNQEPQDRVLLMDVSQAAFGLNIYAASRIYFVNPVFRENIEAQAIKRAHRIGQTKPVHVETLVLEGSIEEKMLERSKRMTRAEHLNATHLEDDGGVKEIIQSARPLPIRECDKTGYASMAPIPVPQQIWFREGWKEYSLASGRGQSKKRKSTTSNEDDGGEGPGRKKKRAKRTLAYVDCAGANAALDQYQVVDESVDDVPLLQRSAQRATSSTTPQTTGSAVIETRATAATSSAVKNEEGIGDALKDSAESESEGCELPKAKFRADVGNKISISALLDENEEERRATAAACSSNTVVIEEILRRL